MDSDGPMRSQTAAAEHRAARIAAAGLASVVDLGCGTGTDLVALARAGLTAAGVDVDPDAVQAARARLQAAGLGGAVTVADAVQIDTSPFDVVVLADLTVPWSFVESLLARDSCVRLSPDFPRSRVPPGVEAEWVSHHGDLVEVVLWSGRLATVSQRATVIGDGGLATLTDEDEPVVAHAAGGLARFLYEADPAVAGAGLLPALAAGVRGHVVGGDRPYVASDHAFHTPYATSYRVLEEVPLRLEPL